MWSTHKNNGIPQKINTILKRSFIQIIILLKHDFMKKKVGFRLQKIESNSTIKIIRFILISLFWKKLYRTPKAFNIFVFNNLFTWFWFLTNVAMGNTFGNSFMILFWINSHQKFPTKSELLPFSYPATLWRRE